MAYVKDTNCQAAPNCKDEKKRNARKRKHPTAQATRLSELVAAGKTPCINHLSVVQNISEVILLLNLKDNQYFNTQPAWIQESIHQSGKDFESESELVQFVSNIDPSGGLPPQRGKASNK